MKAGSPLCRTVQSLGKHLNILGPYEVQAHRQRGAEFYRPNTGCEDQRQALPGHCSSDDEQGEDRRTRETPRFFEDQIRRQLEFMDVNDEL